jgi:CelD/BcsL family acetyltransferase involved in cellulose biosynthesis
VLIAELIADAIGRGCRRLDMLKGDLGYKYRFGARPRPIRRLLLERA